MKKLKNTSMIIILKHSLLEDNMAEEKQNKLFFVYGTLKRDQYNHYHIKDKSKFIGEVETVEKYPLYLLKEPFPYLQDSIGIGFNIKGELFEIGEEHEKYLDNFEGVPFLYKKGKILVKHLEEIKEVSCYFKTKEIHLDSKKFKNLKLIKEYFF